MLHAEKHKHVLEHTRVLREKQVYKMEDAVFEFWDEIHLRYNLCEELMKAPSKQFTSLPGVQLTEEMMRQFDTLRRKEGMHERLIESLKCNDRGVTNKAKA